MPKEEFGPLAPYCPHARPKKGKRKYDASSLWGVWVEYAAWVNAHPIEIPRQSISKGQVIHHCVVKFRPYVRSEFLRFAKINPSTWRNWQDVPELAGVVQDIDDIIYEQKLIGGFINHFNTTITSQDLGLKTTIEQTNRDGTYEEFLKGARERWEANQQAQKDYEQRRKRTREK